jgi:hypothetical protein
MTSEEERRRDALISGAMSGVYKAIKSIRGTALFGANASAKVEGNTVIVTTHQVGVSGPVYYELQLKKKVS